MGFDSSCCSDNYRVVERTTWTRTLKVRFLSHELGSEEDDRNLAFSAGRMELMDRSRYEDTE